MYSTTDSFGKQVDDLSNNFTTCSGAYALFYWGDGSKTGLRLEAGFIAKEFIDNIEFGHDPEGLLFYDAASDFNVTGDTPYKVTRNSQSPPAIRVDFYSPDNNTIRYASFITRDTNGVTEAQLSRYVKDGKGKWVDHQVATSFGHLYKQTKVPTATLTLQPIGKKITWEISGDTTHASNVNGNFVFNKLAEMSAGATAEANYDEDRVIFHNNNALLGVFFPSSPLPFDNHASTTQPKATVSNI